MKKRETKFFREDEVNRLLKRKEAEFKKLPAGIRRDSLHELTTLITYLILGLEADPRIMKRLIANIKTEEAKFSANAAWDIANEVLATYGAKVSMPKKVQGVGIGAKSTEIDEE